MTLFILKSTALENHIITIFFLDTLTVAILNAKPIILFSLVRPLASSVLTAVVNVTRKAPGSYVNQSHN